VKLTERINSDITTAMKAKDSSRLSALRLLKTAIVNRSIEQGQDLEDSEVMRVVASLVKQRRDSIEQFKKADRNDLVKKETLEISVLEKYQPPAATPQEVEDAVTAAIAETGAKSIKDLGAVMKIALAKLSSKTAPGRIVNEVVRRKLSGK
tara:strand:- start:1686 stop:2138 length:453 start_codon:yes stop_codon:yes gene_type:complete